MSSRDYEQVSWQSDSLGRDMQIVQDVSLESHGEDSEQVISYNAQMAISPLGKCEAL